MLIFIEFGTFNSEINYTILSLINHTCENDVYVFVPKNSNSQDLNYFSGVSLATRLYILFYECVKFTIVHYEVCCGPPYQVQCTALRNGLKSDFAGRFDINMLNNI